jgi:diguanylate cyclase (GGDEF)-like protein
MDVKLMTIVANAVSALFVILILIGSYRVPKQIAKHTKIFRLCCWACFIGLTLDALAYTLEGKVPYDFILVIINFLAYSFLDIVIMLYSFYVYSVIKESNPNFTKKFPYLITAICCADIIFLFIGTLTQQLFTITNALFKEGPLGYYIFIGPLTCMIVMVIVLFFSHKKLGLEKTIILSIYLIMPFISALFQAFAYNLEMGYVGSALALVLIYVLIQSHYMTEANVRADVYNQLSIKDNLTGLLNRRGYDELLQSLDQSKNYGVVFCDINNLKNVNDTQGHIVGDRLIQKVSQIIQDSFPSDHSFRISGDEFVIISYDDNLEVFQQEITIFQHSMIDNGNLAAYGTATTDGKDILQAIRIAEQHMYEAKKLYYESTGQIRRK